ncbi:O-acetylhomoserine aminocarboxypropyltransferase/cysteine synthase family protein [Clostridium tunisiense]|uniref:O-acetylhomoserine aminocarboxypropyltransferase/cysteine synthase family protein n=1 Tax=Clostridium tunisiense TaxID=219748 RepID=UPI0002E442A8|nr:O-acetylhomoserine aminocarboxypropyltransferase/cysteine synthase family protein [Clostridium tunisiense]
MINSWRKETICVQGGYNPKVGEPRIPAIVQSTTYKYDNPDHLAELFDLKTSGHMYSRISNPTVEAFESKVAALEKGVGALATASGQSATLLSILNICSSGDNILAASTLYGGTFTLFSSSLKKFGVEVSFVNPDLPASEILSYAKENTKAIFAETISNPSLKLLDFEKFSYISKTLGIPLIVDNTFPTPVLCNPFEHGANIIVHSATKYIDGHGTSIGGVIVDGGNFNWCNGKFPELTEPDPSYHGLSYIKEFKNLAYITKARVHLLRDLGPALSPFNGFLLNLGLDSLTLRMERHSSNALNLSKFLSTHPKVSWVNYPKLEGHPSFELSEKYLPLGGSGIVTFGVEGGRAAAKKLIENLKLASLVVHLGDVRTSVIHPASTTHRQLSDEELAASGVHGDLIRVSVGIEHIEDIINDFVQGLDSLKEEI